MSEPEHSDKNNTSNFSGVSSPQHRGGARFNLFHAIWVCRTSLSPLSFNPDRFWRDDWRSVGALFPLKWLQVSLQGYPPCLICCRVPVGPQIALISWSEGKQVLLSKSSPAAYEWQQERWSDRHRVNHNQLGMSCLRFIYLHVFNSCKEPL